MSVTTRNLLVYLCAAAILVTGALFWTSDLTADPPLYIAGMGQSLSTDPAQYVYHARNEILYDDPDPFDYPRWLVYQKSLVSQLAYLWFSIAGVSLKQANMVGIFLMLGALLVFALAISRHHRPWVTLVFVLCFMINVTLLVHGRLPYLENGLMAVTALVYLVYSRWGHRIWGLAVAGALVAVSMLMGKLFGALLLPALLAAEWFSGAEERVKRILWPLGSFVATAFVMVILLYGTNLSAVLGYFSEQSYGLRGFPAGLSSPWGFFEHLISYGFKNRLFFLDSDLVLFLVGAGFLLTYLLAAKSKLGSLSPVLRLSIFAVLFIFLGLMPLNYSPIRYTLFLVPAIIIVWFSLLDHMTAEKLPRPGKSGYLLFLPLFLLVWHTFYQVVGLIFFVNDTPTRPLVWSTLPAALIVTFAIRHLMNKGRIGLKRGFLYGAIALAVAFSIGINAFRIKTRVLLTTNYSIVEANEDIRQILGPDAVVSGSYAAALTIDNRLKSFIHLFGVAEVDSSLFDDYPITHLAIDSSNWLEAVKNYPSLETMYPITAYWIRDNMVRICNVANEFGNPAAMMYRKTDYEKAVNFFTQRMYDSALVALGKFLAVYPECRSANLFLADMLSSAGRYQQAATIMQKLANKYPTDYYTNLICGRTFQIMAIQQKNNYLLNLANEYYNKAVQSNPFRHAHAKAMYDQTKQQFSAGADTTAVRP